MNPQDIKDSTWYIKWISSIIILFAISIRSAALPSLIWLDIFLSLFGALGWAYVGFRWNDRALLLLNGVVTVILFAGLLRIVSDTI